MPLPERNRPRFPSLKTAGARATAPKPPQRPILKTSRPSPASSSGDEAATGDASSAKPARPVLRRRAPRRSTPAFDDATYRIFLRLGVAGFIGVFGLLAGAHRGGYSRSGNEIYFDAVVAFEEAMERRDIPPEKLRRRVESLPVSAVSDPTLKEFHSVLLQLVAVVESGGDKEKLRQLLDRHDALVDEINRKYANR